MRAAAREAIRIVRGLQVSFLTGEEKFGSAFLAPATGRLLTCAHVVLNDQGQRASKVRVTCPDRANYETVIDQVNSDYDLATLHTNEDKRLPVGCKSLPELGDLLIFAGSPQGVRVSSIFPGMVSAVGAGLLSRPRCDLIQIAGMINNGNSGGPLLNEAGEVVGIITSKYVPLLIEIDKLRNELEKIPQFPSEVAVGSIDFAKFVNMTIQSISQLSAVLRLVQVGTGWAVPVQYFNSVGGV